MKVWVLGRGYPTPENRMSGSFELDQAKLLARNGYDVTYFSLSLNIREKIFASGFQSFEENKVKIYSYSHFYFPGRLRIILGFYINKCWQMLFSQAESENGKPDIIHIHYPTLISSIDVIENYRLQGVKIFVTEHWTQILKNKLRSHELKRLNYYTSHANCFITVGQNLQDSIRKIADVSVPMEIVPNMFSPFFKPALKKDKKKFTFVMSGRMVPHKRFDVVVKAFLQTFAGQDKFHLKLIGDGPEKNRLIQLSKNSSQVEFTGSLKGDFVAKEVAQSDVLICVSSLETFAVPIIEAWACGIPVVTLDSIPASRYCDQSNGIVIREDSLTQLGQVMEQIYMQYDCYDKEKISHYAQATFGDKAIFERLKDIYTKFG